MDDIFIARFNQLLEEKGISAKKLCQIMGISCNTAYEWINADRVMSTTNFFMLCEHLDVNPQWLYGTTNVRTPYKTISAVKRECDTCIFHRNGGCSKCECEHLTIDEFEKKTVKDTIYNCIAAVMDLPNAPNGYSDLYDKARIEKVLLKVMQKGGADNETI